METIVVDCSGCKARLKIKAPPGRALSEVKCPKCGVKNAVSKGGGGTPEPKEPTPQAEKARSAPIDPNSAIPAPSPVVPVVPLSAAPAEAVPLDAGVEMLHVRVLPSASVALRVLLKAVGAPSSDIVTLVEAPSEMTGA